jgi:hypothetical protein
MFDRDPDFILLVVINSVRIIRRMCLQNRNLKKGQYTMTVLMLINYLLFLGKH